MFLPSLIEGDSDSLGVVFNTRVETCRRVPVRPRPESGTPSLRPALARYLVHFGPRARRSDRDRSDPNLPHH